MPCLIVKGLSWKHGYATLDVMASETKLREQLAQAGDRQRAARAEVTEAMGQIERLIPKAIEAGVPIRQIAILTGLTRPTIYKLAGPAAPSPHTSGRRTGGKPARNDERPASQS